MMTVDRLDVNRRMPQRHVTASGGQTVPPGHCLLDINPRFFRFPVPKPATFSLYNFYAILLTVR